MKIIIAGAGQIGVALAKYLRAENNDITLIDQNPAKLGSLNEQLDIQTIEGNASFPGVLEKAGADHADVFLGVTSSDEMNIVSCAAAQTLFHVPKRIARLSAPEYLTPTYKEFLKALSVDVVVSPEIETAHRIFENMPVSGAVDVVTMGDALTRFIGLRCKKTSPMVGRSVAELKALAAPAAVSFVAIKRRTRMMPLNGTLIRPGDDVYFLVDKRHMIQVLDTLGYETVSPKYVIIFGSHRVAFELARLLEADSDPHEITLVEQNPEKARRLAEKLDKTLVMNGDGLDDTFAEELNLKNYHLSVAATSSDENNILLSLMAKRSGVVRTCALIDNPLYNTVLSGLGVDTTVNPNEVMVSSILQYLRKGRVRNDYVIQSGAGEMLEIEVLATSKITKAPLGKLSIPDGVVIAGVVRAGLFMLPGVDVTVREKDIVLVYAEHNKIRDVEKLFSVGFSFF